MVVDEHHLAARPDLGQQCIDDRVLQVVGNLVKKEEAADPVVEAATRAGGVGDPHPCLRIGGELALHVLDLQGRDVDDVEPAGGADRSGEFGAEIAVGVCRLHHRLAGGELDACRADQPRQVAPEQRRQKYRIVENEQTGRGQIGPPIVADQVLREFDRFVSRGRPEVRLESAVHGRLCPRLRLRSGYTETPLLQSANACGRYSRAQ